MELCRSPLLLMQDPPTLMEHEHCSSMCIAVTLVTFAQSLYPSRNLSKEASVGSKDFDKSLSFLCFYIQNKFLIKLNHLKCILKMIFFLTKFSIFWRKFFVTKTWRFLILLFYIKASFGHQMTWSSKRIETQMLSNENWI